MSNQLARRRGGRGLYKKPGAVEQNIGKKGSKLPEYLEQAEVNALMAAAVEPKHRLLMLVQWRAGLRISEAINLERRDLQMTGDRPQVFVRAGKGNKDRYVPMHAELRAGLETALQFIPRADGRLFDVSRGTAWRWVKAAYDRAAELQAIPAGKEVGTHTLRHSFARHCLASGVPINVLQLWLGHSSMQTTMVYLRLFPDPLGLMDRVP